MKYTKIRKIKNLSDEKIYLKHNKKIRGLPRLVKGINSWTNNNLTLDLEYLNSVERYYVKLCFSPFYNLFYQKNPPHWYKVLIVKSLLKIFDNWSKILNELNIKSYLKIWIMDKRFIHSQVVVAVGEQIDFYDTAFVQRDKINQIPLLNNFYCKYPFIEKLYVQLNESVGLLNTAEDSLTKQDIAKLKKDTIEEKIEIDNSISYFYITDKVYLCGYKTT